MENTMKSVKQKNFTTTIQMKSVYASFVKKKQNGFTNVNYDCQTALGMTFEQMFANISYLILSF